MSRATVARSSCTIADPDQLNAETFIPVVTVPEHTADLHTETPEVSMLACAA